MKWTLRGRSYLCLPYSIEPGVMGWDVWLVGVKRVARDIRTLKEAKRVAEINQEHGEVPA